MVVLMVNKKIGLIGLAVASVILSGCATSNATFKEDTGLDPTSRKAFSELRDISIEARHELRILAKAQESIAQESLTKNQHEQRFFQATHVPDGFEKRVDFSVTDQALKAAEAVAIVAGYKFKVTGKPLSNEPWVRIRLKDQPLNDALKELGVQTGDSIRIEIHPPAKLMRFIYKDL